MWPVWLNCWVFIYELSDFGFESCCCHLNFRYCTCFEQEVPSHSGNSRVLINLETRTWHDNNIQFCKPSLEMKYNPVKSNPRTKTWLFLAPTTSKGVFLWVHKTSFSGIFRFPRCPFVIFQDFKGIHFQQKPFNIWIIRVRSASPQQNTPQIIPFSPGLHSEIGTFSFVHSAKILKASSVLKWNLSKIDPIVVKIWPSNSPIWLYVPLFRFYLPPLNQAFIFLIYSEKTNADKNHN